MKYAVPVSGGVMCSHFGHCEQFALIDVDEKNKEVSIGDKVINLTPTEYDLLLYLYQHTEQLCQRADIIADVFGYEELDAASGKSLLNTHINRLRQKVEPNPSHPLYILTMRGQGYKLRLYSE